MPERFTHVSTTSTARRHHVSTQTKDESHHIGTRKARKPPLPRKISRVPTDPETDAGQSPARSRQIRSAFPAVSPERRGASMANVDHVPPGDTRRETAGRNHQTRGAGRENRSEKGAPGRERATARTMPGTKPGTKEPKPRTKEPNQHGPPATADPTDPGVPEPAQHPDGQTEGGRPKPDSEHPVLGATIPDQPTWNHQHRHTGTDSRRSGHPTNDTTKPQPTDHQRHTQTKIDTPGPELPRPPCQHGQTRQVVGNT